jgi:hypothetical protein
MSCFYYWVDILMMNMCVGDLSMSYHKKDGRKSPIIEASASGSHQEEEASTLGPIYNDTTRFIEKGISLKWGEVFQMFKKHNFPVEVEYEY